jgi:hypothetical protein
MPTCRIVQGSGLLGAKAECTGQTLGAGQQLKVQLNGGMSVTLDPSEGFEVWPRDNFPNTPTTEELAIFNVALNP